MDKIENEGLFKPARKKLNMLYFSIYVIVSRQLFAEYNSLSSYRRKILTTINMEKFVTTTFF